MSVFLRPVVWCLCAAQGPLDPCTAYGRVVVSLCRSVALDSSPKLQSARFLVPGPLSAALRGSKEPPAPGAPPLDPCRAGVVLARLPVRSGAARGARPSPSPARACRRVVVGPASGLARGEWGAVSGPAHA